MQIEEEESLGLPAGFEEAMRVVVMRMEEEGEDEGEDENLGLPEEGQDELDEAMRAVVMEGGRRRWRRR